jgi:hypothetical protein
MTNSSFFYLKDNQKTREDSGILIRRIAGLREGPTRAAALKNLNKPAHFEVPPGNQRPPFRNPSTEELTSQTRHPASF